MSKLKNDSNSQKNNAGDIIPCELMAYECKKLIPERLPPACDEEERFNAMRLIRTGKKVGDELTVRIGQARLRVVEGRATPEDLDLLYSRE